MTTDVHRLFDPACLFLVAATMVTGLFTMYSLSPRTLPPCPPGERTLAEYARIGHATTGIPSTMVCDCPLGLIDGIESDGAMVFMYCDRRHP